MDPHKLVRKVLGAAGFQNFNDKAVADGAKELLKHLPLPKIHETLWIAKGQLEAYYRLMNWFASGKCLENVGGTDPNAVCAEGYGIIAGMYKPIMDLAKQMNVQPLVETQTPPCPKK